MKLLEGRTYQMGYASLSRNSDVQSVSSCPNSWDLLPISIIDNMGLKEPLFHFSPQEH